MKKVLVVLSLLCLTGCTSYTQEDADRIQEIVMGTGETPTQDEFRRLDANGDGCVSPADYVVVINSLKGVK